MYFTRNMTAKELIDEFIGHRKRLDVFPLNDLTEGVLTWRSPL